MRSRRGKGRGCELLSVIPVGEGGVERKEGEGRKAAEISASGFPGGTEIHKSLLPFQLLFCIHGCSVKNEVGSVLKAWEEGKGEAPGPHAARF